jgi:type VI secretion system secreted protein VgrG
LFTNDNGTPILNSPYKAYLADGSIVEGFTDDKGYTKLFTSAQAQDISVNLIMDVINA